MKKRLMILLLALFVLFTCSITASVLYTKQSRSALERLITLHRAEHARGDLIIALYEAQANYGVSAAVQISERIENTASKCNTCHHAPAIQARINNLQAAAKEFASSIRSAGSPAEDEKSKTAIFYNALAKGRTALRLAHEMTTEAHHKMQIKTQDTMQKIAKGQILIAIVLGISFFIAVIISRNLVRSVALPISKLIYATREIASGNTGYRLSVDEKNEFGILAEHFNAMSSALEEKQKIEASELKYRTVSEFTTDWEYWIDEKREMVFVSPSCKEVTGYSQEEFIENPKLCTNIIYAHDVDLFNERHRQFDANEPVQMDFRIVTKSGDIRWLSHRCRPVYIGGVFRGRRVSNRDITEQRRLEDQLRHAQKMEALGTFAGGIVHDFNNILTAIIGYGNLLQINMDATDPLRHHVEQILSAADRAVSLTRGLLAYCRRQPISLQATDLNTVVKMSTSLIERLLRADIELKTKYWPAPLTVLADRHQIEQVMVNLATNARDAMPHGGTISIETSLIKLDQGFVDRHQLARAGEYAIISFSDTGHGMNEKTRESIFEPFFTTKDVGKGTGLGLSIVYGIIKQHGGAIECYSKPGHGARFYIYLPIIKGPSSEPVNRTDTLFKGGTETILLAEDDNIVRSLCTIILEDAGYKVIAAADGAEAVERFLENKDNIHLCLLDVIMPKKNAKEVYEAIRGIRPDIKTIFISGYTSDVFEEGELNLKGLHFISKPVKPIELLKLVRKTLDS